MSEEKNIGEGSTGDSQQSAESNLPAEQFTGEVQPATVQNTEPVPDHKSEIENMEVHHHGHVHEKKKWKEYVFQFFMLFLAVFCGFLAEYQLEHVIENQREKKYMNDMVVNLESDTAMIALSLDFAKVISNGIDSLRQNLYSDSVLEKTGEIYRQEATYMRLIVPHFNDQTITQLRNSGNLRLVKNVELSNMIGDYWNGINRINGITERLENRHDMSAGSSVKIFNRKYIRRNNKTDSSMLSSYTIDPAAQLMSKDKNFLAEHANSLGRISGAINSFLIPMMRIQGREATELIAMIKKEYDLE